MKKLTRRKFIIGATAFLAAGAAAGWPIYRNFGSLPDRIYASPNWHGGSFNNLSAYQVYSIPPNEPEYPRSWLKFLFARGQNRWPDKPVQSVHADLGKMEDGQFVWLGHSSLLLKLDGKIICIDPILSSRASPIPGTIRAWPGATPYTCADLPEIDWLCTSHDHWDHLDYDTVGNIHYKNSLTGLGTGSHFRYWGFDTPEELDWLETRKDGNLRIAFIPSMHFSGRGTVRNKSLWGGFYLDAGSGGKALFTGDGGFGSHFGDIASRFGKPDIIFPDSGQYNRAWHNVHMFPEQAVQASMDSGARLACPVHIGKFTLSWHPWNDPFERFAKSARKNGVPFIMPTIGEIRSIGESGMKLSDPLPYGNI